MIQFVRRTATFVAVLLFSVALHARAACSLAKFDDVPLSYAGPQPRTIQLANLNGDEWPDLIAGNYDVNSHTNRIGNLTLLAGHAGGRWSVIAQYEETEQVGHVAAVDFDGDGDDDVAYYVYRGDNTHELRVLRNDRKSFVHTGSVPFDARTGGLAAGDFDGDGREDLLYTQDTPGLLLMSNGDGTFDAQAFPEADYRPAALADLNGDGRTDVVTTHGTRNVLLYLGDATTGLRLAQTITLTRDVGDVWIADSDGNGLQDIVAAHRGMITIDTIRNAARPSQSAAERTVLQVNYLDRPATGDVNGDGLDDFVYVGYPGVQSVISQPGGEPLTRDHWFVPGRVFGGFGEDEELADVDRDGDLDLIVVTVRGVATLLNDGNGNFAAPRFITWALAAADFNGDGRDDLIDHTGIRLAGPGGTFTPIGMREAYTQVRILFAAGADVNRDGKQDLVQVFGAGPGVARRIEVHFGNGDGTLLAPVTTPLETDPDRVLLHDLTRDAIPDILLYDSPSYVVREGTSDGTYGAAVPYSGLLNGREIAAGDFDGDGDADLILAANEDHIRWNDGSGKFSAPVAITPIGQGELFVADLDDDGRDDLLVADLFMEGAVRRYMNRGSAQFVEEPMLRTTLAEVNQIVLRDFNGDGFGDLLVSEGGSTAVHGRLALFHGDGNGQFPRVVEMDSVAIDAIVGDFDGDGAPDLLDGGFVRLNECAPVRRRSVGR